MLSNVCTPIGLVNGAKYISTGIILDDNNILNLRLVDKQAKNCSNLLLPEC